MADPAYLQPYQGLHDDPYDADAQNRAKRGYVGGLLDSVTDAAGQLPATALHVAKQLNPIGGAINSYQQAKSLLSGDTSLGQLGNSLLDLTPIGPARDAVKASGEIGTAAGGGDSYGAGQATGKLLGAGLAVMPGVGPEARAVMRDERAAAPIIAYHGSPHDFDKFGFQNIGGGEGGQAFGHGLYFAENEGVARSYRDALGGDALDLGGKKITPTPGSPQDMALAWLRSAPSDAEPYAAARRNLRSTRDAPETTPAMREKYDAALKALDDWQLAGGKPTAGGHMYEVGIHADPQKFLDWDKPLSGQSPDVQSVASTLKDPMLQAWTKNGALPHVTGQTLYRQLSGGLTRGAVEKGLPVEASTSLSQAGIPGIRYLDQGSRGPSTIYNVGAPRPDFGPYSPFTSQADAEKHLEQLRGHGFSDAEIKQQVQPQTSNYVVFPTHDEIIKIMRKYGLAPLAAGGAAAATVPGLLNGDDASSVR